MNIAVLDLFLRNVNYSEFSAKRVLEVSNKFVNDSVRPLIERFCDSKEYVDADVESGNMLMWFYRLKSLSITSVQGPSTLLYLWKSLNIV